MPDEAPQDTPAPPPPAPEPGKSAHHLGRPELPSLRFIDELKRRNVGRVAILYVVVGYVALEVFEVFFHLLDMPAWAGRVAVLVMAVGFPLVLIFAWAYEVTPEGLKPTQEVAPHQSIRHLTGRRLDRAIIAVLAIALSYFVIDKFWISNHRTAVKPAALITALTATNAPRSAIIPDKSVAVLPFVDMSEKKDQEYFSDGLSEELIDKLAHAPDLKVIARTSSFQFKGKNDDMRTIGRKLSVANLLEGSVRTSGNVIRVTAQLINVIDGTHRWSETYDRKRGDIFKIQDEIAAAVVSALKATMATMPARASARSANVDSYNEVLRGSYFWYRSTQDDSERALSAFRQALTLDPMNAEAWVGIAATYNERGSQGWMPPPEAYREARQAIDRALAISPNLPNAHLVLAYLEEDYNHDFEAYRREFKRALQLDPALATTVLDEGMNAYTAGQSAKAAQFLRRNVERDPLDTLALTWLAEALYASDNIEEARRVWLQVLEINPNYSGAHCELGQILLAQHQPGTALAVMSEETDERQRMICMPNALWVLGRRAEADALLAQVQDKFPDTMAYAIAQSYALRNDKDAAFKWLNRAYDNREPQITSIKADPEVRNLRGDSRFESLIQKLKLPE